MDSNGQIFYVVYHDPVIGESILPRIAGRPGDGLLRPHRSNISSETILNHNVPVNQGDKELLSILDELIPERLIRTFSKKHTTLKELLDSKSERFRKELFRPYIEKRLHRMILLCRENNIPLYLLNSRGFLSQTPLMHIHEPAAVRYHFHWSRAGITYSLQVKNHDDIIQLTDQNSMVLCDRPGILIHQNRIFFIEGVNGNKLRPFLNKKQITIPPQIEKKYFKTFIRNLLTQTPVESSGFTIHEFITEPVPLILLQVDWQNDPVILLKFNYQSGEIGADYQNPRIVKMKDDHHPPEFEVEIRSIEFEKQTANFLCSLGLTPKGSFGYRIPVAPDKSADPVSVLVDFIRQNNKDLKLRGILIRQKLDANYLLDSPELKTNIENRADWFDIRVEIRVGDAVIRFKDLRKNILNKNPRYLLPDGQVFMIPDEWFSRFTAWYLFGKTNQKGLLVQKMHYPGIVDEDLVKRIFTHGDEDKLQDRTILRPYQQAGFKWLCGLNREGFGGCLADDMGLGKTVQVLTLLDHFKNKDQYPLLTEPVASSALKQLTLFHNGSSDSKRVRIKHSLVVVPVSLLHNWENEIQKFTPNLVYYRMTGAQRITDRTYLAHYDLILTTYGTVRNDIETLQKIPFFYLILDESQNIKNPGSVTYKAIKKIRASHRLVMTGTPVENSLGDLWAQLSLVNPGILGNYTWFRKHFMQKDGITDPDERSVLLKKMVRPFIMRRTKEAVAPDLPPLNQEVHYCEPTVAQWSLYEKTKSGVRNLFLGISEQGVAQQSHILMLQHLTRLRLIANHPVLIDKTYTGGSGKADEVFGMIRQIVAGHHKVLIFSQFVKHLNLVAENLSRSGIPFLRLTGSDRETTRAAAIRQFEKDPEIPVFLISLKAGGTGLNLTSADYVFLLDPWWNPATEEQAISRAHRIGQSKPVFVYRFITTGTIEEKILKLQERKKNLADLFVNRNALNAMNLEDMMTLI